MRSQTHYELRLTMFLSNLAVMQLGYSPSYWLTQLLNGFSLGLIFVLVSIGLTVMFGLMGVVNFAHGDFLLVGAYVTWIVTDVTGSVFIGFGMSIIAVALLSFMVEYTLLRRIYEYDPLLQLLITFGLAEVIREGVEIIWGTQGKNVPLGTWVSDPVDLVLFTYPTYRLFVTVAGVLITIATYLFLTRTDYGLVISAGTHDREMVDTLGIDISKTYTLVFVMAGGLVGLAGGLVAPIRSVYPTLGVDLLIPSFIVVIVGGVGSFRGSVIAGILIGEIVVFTSIVQSSLSNVVIFALMAVVLLLRPRGLFGKEGALE